MDDHGDRSGPALSIRLFGNFAMEVDGEPFVMTTPRRTLPILAYLLLNRDSAVSREFLAYLIWPDDAEETARTKLRGNLYELVRALPPAPSGHWIVADGDNVAWNPRAALRLDVEDFSAGCADPERRAEAVALYRGELLAALYDEWVFPLRERYRNLYLSTLSGLIVDARRRRDFQQAIGHAQQLLAVDPWREDIVRQLIAIRHESGDRSGALAEYQRFAGRLRADLDIEPMPESLALRDAIARNEPIDAEPDAGLSQAAATRRARSSLPFVGRAAELELLTEAWNSAAHGRGSALCISGEPGIGKSRLALEFSHRVEEMGGRVIAGGTGSPEALPYQSLVEALRSALPLVASLRLRDVWLAGVGTLVPELRGLLPNLPELPRMQGPDERGRLFEALTRTLEALSRPRPLLVLLDDVHWAEEATCAALRFLLGRLPTMRVLLVLTCREEEVRGAQPAARLLRDSLAAGSMRNLSLGPLSGADVETLTQTLPDAFAAGAPALHAASDGNPLFLTQLVDGGRSDATSDRPSTVRGLAAERIERLSPEARTIAQIAALAGTRFSRELVLRVSGWDGAAADLALDELIDRRIVREASGRGLFDYAFAHDLVRQTVAEDAPPERSPARHRRIARALEELYPERAADLAPSVARHFDLAGDAAGAARHYLVAASRALTIGALDECSANLARGLELVTEPTLRIDLLLAAETLATRRMASEKRAEVLAELDALTQSAGDDELRLQVMLRRCDYLRQLDDVAAEHAALAELRLLVTARGDAVWTGRLGLVEARSALAAGELARAAAAAEAALAAFTSAGHTVGASEARYCLAEALIHQGLTERAELLLEDIRLAGDGVQDAPLLLQALKAAYQLAFTRRDRERGLALAKATLEAAAICGDRRAEAEGHNRMSAAMLGIGNYREAREHCRKAAAVYAEVGDNVGGAVMLTISAQLETLRGNPEAARRNCERALAIFSAEERHGRRRITGLLTLSSSKLMLGDVAGARRDASEALELTRMHGFGVLEASALEDLAYAEAGGADYATARALMERSLTLRAETDSTAWTIVSYASLALWCAATGDVAAASDYIERTLAGEADLVLATPWPQDALWAVAQALRACGRDAEARPVLKRAHALSLEMLQAFDEIEHPGVLAIPWHRELLAAFERDEWPELPDHSLLSGAGTANETVASRPKKRPK